MLRLRSVLRHVHIRTHTGSIKEQTAALAEWNKQIVAAAAASAGGEQSTKRDGPGSSRDVGIFPDLRVITLPNVGGRYRDELRQFLRGNAELRAALSASPSPTSARALFIGRPVDSLIGRLVDSPATETLVAAHPSLDRILACAAALTPAQRSKALFLHVDSVPFACQLLSAEPEFGRILLPDPVPWPRKAASIRRLPTEPNFAFFHQLLSVGGRLVMTTDNTPLMRFAEAELEKSSLSVAWRRIDAAVASADDVGGGAALHHANKALLAVEKVAATPASVCTSNAAFDFRRRYYADLAPDTSLLI